jgi:hypothetical protein
MPRLKCVSALAFSHIRQPEQEEGGSTETGVSIEPFSGIGWTEGANSPPLCDFRANLDNFGRIDIVANHVGIVETGSVVEATAASWARYLVGKASWDCEFTVNLRSAFFENEAFDTCNDRR